MKQKKMIDYYNHRAPEYEQIYYRDNAARRKEIDDEAERLKKLANGKTVLDIACGTGYWTSMLSQSAKQLIATDISLEMIGEARRKDFKTSPLFVQADLYALPFRPKTFDLVTVGFWFSHEPRQNYRQLFQMLLSLLKSGGQIWFIDNNYPAEGPNVHSESIDEHGNNFKRRYLDNGDSFIILKNYFTEHELSEIFSGLGSESGLIYQKYYWSVLLTI